MKTWMAVIGALVAMALAGCAQTPWYTHRFRLHVEVETLDGIKTGSSVIEASQRRVYGLNGTVGQPRISGDAVFVDLGGGRNVVALTGC